MKRILPITLLGCVLATGAGCIALGGRDAGYQPHIDPSNFQATVDNPYHPLVPGTVLKYIEKAGRETSETEVTVTRDTKVVMGVACVVVRDRVKENGVLREETYDWYAQDKQGTVWHFGAAAREFKSGGRVNTAGSWEAGVKGAQPGIVMPGSPKPGRPYRQEYARDEAEDMAQIVAVDETVTVPCGAFKDCVRTKEWSMLESGTETKWYARGVGVVQIESTGGEVSVLVSVTQP
ncbi:MAG: hypothetical protein EXS18_03865 [Verrucomicrobiae bacterium]|nr:hypothetical protein [Verrucomicrobiae bacterium]